jgi:hypothetical protein
MRALVVALAIAVAAPASPLVAQRADTSRPPTSPKTSGARDSIDLQIRALQNDPEGTRLPKQDSISMGARTVPAGAVEQGPVATAGGNLDVFGTVNGDAIAIGGDVVVHRGGVVTGTALSAFGRVRLEGGTVNGEMRALNGAVGVTPPPAPSVSGPSTQHALALSLGWLGVLWLIGIGVLLFAGPYLDGVSDALAESFSRSFWLGVASQLALAPVLLLLVVALAVTIIGVLLIPFAVVAFVLATVGLMTLGFLAVARVTGESMGRAASRRLSARGAALRALIVGLGGATVRSRGGVRRAQEQPGPETRVNEVAWQTPTPVTGVVAARRPRPTAGSSSRSGQ